MSIPIQHTDHHAVLTAGITVAHIGRCLALDVGAWFDEPSFAGWVNRRAGRGLATHHPQGQPMGDWSDVFVLVDPSLSGAGSDDPTCFDPDAVERRQCIPETYWLAILAACRRAFGSRPMDGLHIVVWLRPT